MTTTAPVRIPMRGRVTFALSVVCVDLTRLELSLQTTLDLGIERAHVDLIDLSFGNLGLAPETISDLRARFDMPIDVHLMVDKPEGLLPDLVRRGADSVTVHQRCVTPPVLNWLLRAQDGGCGVGVAIEPGELICESLLEQLQPQKLTVMTVHPGGAGRPFQPDALATLRRAAELQTGGVVGVVEADGALGPETVGTVLSHGARRLVLGSSVFPRRDMQCNRMTELLEAITAYDERRMES